MLLLDIFFFYVVNTVLEFRRAGDPGVPRFFQGGRLFELETFLLLWLLLGFLLGVACWRRKVGAGRKDASFRKGDLFVLLVLVLGLCFVIVVGKISRGSFLLIGVGCGPVVGLFF